MAIGDSPKIPDFGNGAPGKYNNFDSSEVYAFLRTLLFLLIAAIFLRASVVEAYKIPSGSMIPTLREGDQILVNKLSYGFRLPFVTSSLFQFDAPKRGDVVVFTRPDEKSTPDDESSINIIKRAVGLPGDVVEVRGTQVFVNNQPLEEPYARWDENGSSLGNFGPVTVPEGHILLLGDNRDHSRDSRFWEVPFLAIERVKGKAFVIYWSSYSINRIGNKVQ